MTSVSPLSSLLLATRPPEPAPLPASPARDQILFVGLNPQATTEIAALRQRAAVSVIHNQHAPEQPFRSPGPGGRPLTFDLGSQESLAAFAATLGLPGAQTAAVTRALTDSPPEIRDELAQVARAWAPAERGGAAPGRLVLSGHGFEGAVFGEDNGMLTWERLGALARAMPRAAAQVEDVHVAACSTGSERMVSQLRGAFPGLRSLWAYEDMAPGSASGATTHQARWERATRGAASDLSPAAAAGTRWGDHVAVWSLDGGYQPAVPPGTLDEARARVDASDAFSRAWSGALRVEDPSRGPLRTYYQDLTALLRHPELPAPERRAIEERRDRSLRLLHFESRVVPRFEALHRRALDAGYASAGLPRPPFAALNREQVLAQVRAFEAHAAALVPCPEEVRRAARLLGEGLRDLSPAAIPASWL